METNSIINWSEITDLIGYDLAIYTFYNASAMAADTIDGMLVMMRSSEYLSEETLRNMYLDIVFGLAQDELEEQLGSDEKEVEIDLSALEEGFREFTNWRDLTNRDDALLYLRYLLDWEEEHFDWKEQHPISFEEFLMHRE